MMTDEGKADGLDDAPEGPSGDIDLDKGDAARTDRGESVDLSDKSLVVCISDALTQQDKVKFTVQTKTTIAEFKKADFSVVRLHEEFVWLHERFVENEEYAGIIIPPPPPRPDFDSSRQKLQKLGEISDGMLTKEEFEKMKKELEAEYLATFKKTVAMHEVFLQRLAQHPALRMDVNFRVFLEYQQDLSIRQKNTKEKVGWLAGWVTKSVDQVLRSGQKDADEFYEINRTFLVEYHAKIKDVTGKADRMVKERKGVSECYINISSRLVLLATGEDASEMSKLTGKLADCLEKIRKLEGRVASDEDLKLSDTFRYYMKDSEAAKDLLYRRSKALALYETANKDLDKARAKGKDVQTAEKAQTAAHDKCEKISKNGREELELFKSRRIAYFQKNLRDLVELEVKHSKAQIAILDDCIKDVKAC